MTLSGIYTWHWFPEVPSSHRGNSSARAFLHDAPLLLLDEPTSNLDSLNESIILRSLKKMGKDKTVILVSHRESTMAVAEKVYQMENGFIQKYRKHSSYYNHSTQDCQFVQRWINHSF